MSIGYSLLHPSFLRYHGEVANDFECVPSLSPSQFLEISNTERQDFVLYASMGCHVMRLRFIPASSQEFISPPKIPSNFRMDYFAEETHHPSSNTVAYPLCEVRRCLLK
jgi:hypothetical protein